MKKLLKRKEPMEFPIYTLADIAAIKAVNAGNADIEQQKRAMGFIIKNMCQVGSLSFNVDPHVEGFCEGKRLIGIQLINIIETPINQFKATKKEE